MPNLRTVSCFILLAFAALAGFAVFTARITGGMTLDFALTVAMGQSLLTNYTGADFNLHVTATRVLDMGLPALYTTAILLALSRYASRGWFLILAGLAIFAMVLDFYGNSLILRTLAGEDGHLHAIATLNVVRFSCISAPVLVGLVGWGKEILGR